MTLPPRRFELAAAVRRATADLPAGVNVLVACSGGPDSLALAAAVADSGITGIAAVVDHGLQPESEQVAAVAAGQCRGLGLTALVLSARVVATGSGPEADARAARYAALDSCADEVGAAAVLLGHTRDDQAESVLLGLARGSGTRSLAGMPQRRGRYRRPLLATSRAVVSAALQESGLAAWQDPHNSDPRYLRARVRSRVMPVLVEQLGPGVAEGLVRTATLARADADALDQLATDQHRRLQAEGWQVDALAQLIEAVRWRVLRLMLLRAGCPAADLTLDHVMAVDGLITGWHGQGPLHLPGRIRVTRSYGTLEAKPLTSGSED